MTRFLRFLPILILLLPLVLGPRPASAGDINITLVGKTSHSAEISWEAYPGASSYTVYYDYVGGSGTCAFGPTGIGSEISYATGETLPCTAAIFFIVSSDNGGMGTLSVETDVCSCLEADVNDDCAVNSTDQDLVQASGGSQTACAGPFSAKDVDRNALVNGNDLTVVESFLGQTCDPCISETHGVCNGVICEQVPGVGEDACTNDADCCLCPEGGWTSGNCGEGTCSASLRLQYCNLESCSTLYRCQSDATCLGTLKGRVYLDANRDGAFQTGTDSYTQYPGAGCTIASDLAATISWAGASSGSTTVNLCDPAPYYSTPLPPGSYSVSIQLPSGYAATSVNPISSVVRTQEVNQVWFGVGGGAIVTGRIWNNTGGSNPTCMDKGAAGLSRLVCASGSGVCQTSEADGVYTLENVPVDPDGLEVCVTPENSWRTYCSNKTLIGNCAIISSFTGDVTVNFGLKQEPAAWFHVSEGDMQAAGVFFSFINPLNPTPYLIYGSDGNPENGFGVLTSGNQIDLNGQKVSPDSHNWYQGGYGFGISFSEALPIDFEALWSQAEPDPVLWQNLPPGKAKKLSGFVFGGALHPFYSLDGPGVAVFLARGDVRVFSIEKAAWSPPNSHIMLIVKGSVTLERIGNPFSSDDKLDATVVVLDDGSPMGGRFEIENFDNPAFRQRDRKIRIKGMIYAENGVSLPRDRYRIDQNLDPVEVFEYQPFFLQYAPSFIKKRHLTWREVE